MNTNIIEKYIEEVLYNRLKTFEIKEKYILDIKQDIKEQMYSLIYHWNDIEFRKAILSIALEEGKFYEPDADVDIKCFVVITVRNSYIENIFSDESYLMELDKQIDEKFIKIVTAEAIEYFKDIDFCKLSRDIKNIEIQDKYGSIIEKYKMAWKALIELGKCEGKKANYNKIEINKKLRIEDICDKQNKIGKQENQKYLIEVQSGINEKFSDSLIEVIRSLITKEGNVLYTDSFKMITRNFEKLLKIIEIILENECYFATSNYLLTNSYVGKRKVLYIAAHTTKESSDKIFREDFFIDLSKFHKNTLTQCIEKMFKK